jgi:hypothetical protein
MMDSVRLEDLVFGVVLALGAAVLLIVAVKSVWRHDAEAVKIAGGVGLMFALFSLILCTGWVNVLPLPK